MGKKQLNKQIGDLGETIAARFIRNKGFNIVELNYWRKWGEIDIVAHETASNGNKPYPIVHFVEVKTVSHETRTDLENAVTHETWRPEDQVHSHKLHQIYKSIETWLAENEYEGEWQIDVVAVRVVSHEKYAVVNLIDNIIEQ